MQTNSFKIGVGAQSSDGTIYMGGIGGGNYFLPQNVTSISHPVSLSFSDLYVNNKIITPQTEYEGRITLSTILDKTRKLELTHNQNNFIIHFPLSDITCLTASCTDIKWLVMIKYGKSILIL